MKKVRCRQTVTAPLFEELEPRLLFSADGAETLAAPVLQQEYEEPAVVAEPESPAEAAAVDQPVVARQQETAVPVAPADDLPPDPSTPEDALPDQSVPEEKATETDPKTDADTGTAADVVEATSGRETDADGEKISQPETSALDSENGIESTPSDQAESDVSDSDGESLENGDIRHELVLINDNVKDGEQLISSMEQEGSDEEHDIEVIILNDQQDGIAQVSDILTDRHDLDAVHIITHGGSGSLALGDDWLHTDALTAESTQITGWGNALSEDGDILLYGCSIGQGEDGRDFVDTLAQLTGADVAASIDTTGHTSMGGDWELEYAAGEIEADVPVSESAQDTWNHLLNPEFRVNTTTGEIQQTSAQTGGSKQAVAMDASGNSVVAWSSWNQDSSGWGVYGQRFNAAGIAQGDEFRINESTTQNQQWVSVAMADDGRFAATWTSENQDGTASSVYTRRFNADGSAAGSEFRVNSTTSGSQGNSAIAMNDSGAFVIVWQGNGSGDSDGIFGQRYAADGNTVGGEFRVNNTTGGLQENPAVAINSSGAFSIAWESNENIYLEYFDSSGIKQNIEAKVNSDNIPFFLTIDNSIRPAIVLDESGVSTVVWRSENNAADGIYLRQLDNIGTRLGSGPTAVSANGNPDSTSPSIALDSAGNFLITFDKTGDGVARGVYARSFDSSLNALTDETLINETTSGNQQFSSAAMLNINTYVVVWSGEGSGDSDGVYARQFNAGNTPPTADTGGTYTIDEGDWLTLDGSGSSDIDGDTLDYAWDLNNDGTYGDVTGATPTVDWAALQSYGIDDDGTYTIGLRVNDGQGGTNTATTTLTVNNIAPTLVVTGAATVNAGSIYTLGLSATDPGDDTISSWTINWGDGTIDTINGNPSQATHIYSNTGFTNNILVSVTDEDNTGNYLHTDLFAGHYVRNAGVYRIQGDWGNAPVEFGNEDPLDYAIQPVVGPDGSLYVSGEYSGNIMRYDAGTGDPLGEFASLGGDAGGIAFGPDGNLYVADYTHGSVRCFDGSTGADLGNFVSSGTNGLRHAYGLMFGPDGTIYVNTWNGGDVYRFDGQSGDALDTGAFINTSDTFEQMTIGPDGNIYIADANHNSIIRFNGTDGSAMTDFVSPTDSHLDKPNGLVFGPDGNLYVSDSRDGDILRYNGINGTFIDTYSSGLDKPSLLGFAPDMQVQILTAANTAPTASDDSYSLSEDTSLTTTLDNDLLGNDSDPDSDPLTVNTTPVADVSHGSLVLNSNGTFTYTPDSDYFGSDSFIYEIGDGKGGTDTATVTITVANVNDAPAITSTPSTAATEDTPYTYTFIVNDVDSDDTLTLSAPTLPSWLNFDTNTGVLTGTPTNAEVGDHTVTLRVNDGSVDVDQTFTITVANVNDAPTITSTPSTVATEDTSYAYTFSVNDVDSGDTLTLSAPTLPSWLNFDTNTGLLIGTPTNAEVGDHTMTLRVNDGAVDVDQTFTITVANVNDAPTITSTPSTAATEDTPYAYTFSVNDVDSGDTLTLSTPTLPSWLSFDTNTGLLTGTPTNAEVGDHTVTLRVNDGSVDVDQTFTITVANNTSNNAPTITSTPSTAATEDTPYTYTFIVNDVDSGDTLTLSAPTLPSWLNFDTNTGLLTGTPTNAEVGDHTVTLRVNDGAVDVDQTFTITVANVNDAPTITSSPSTAATEDTPYMYTFIVNDVDSGDTLTLSAPTLPSWLNFDTNTGVLTGTPTNAEVGDHTVTLQVNDGAVDVDQTFTITVANVNDAPTITSTPNTAVTEDTFYTYTFSTNDADSGDTHTLSAPTLPSWLSFDTNTGLLTGTPTNADVGNHTVTLRVNDGSVDVDQTFTITVANVNDAPTITSSPSTAATEDTPYTYTFSVNDVDSGDTLTLSAPTLPSWLSFDTNTGLLTGTPTNAEVGDHTVILRVNDGSVDVGQTFTITVANVNDAPTTSPITLPAIAEDSGGQTISQNELLAHSADVDGDQLTAIDLTISNGAGALSNNGDGTWNYTPAVNDDTAVDFSYTITDGNDAASGSATLDITPVNDIPVAVADNGSTSFNTTVTTGNVLANDDPGDGLVGITGFDAASTHDGTVISNNDGTFTYTPATGFNGTDTFSYTIADADGETSTAIVTMTVASPPDNHPVIGETDGPEQDAAKPGPGATVDETGNDSPPANNEAPVTAETEQKLIVAVDENIPDTAGSDPGTKTRQSPAKNTSSSDETTKTAPVAASEKSHLSRSAAQDAAVLPAGGITVHATPEAPTTIEAADSRVVPARPATQHRQTTGSSTSMLLQQYLDKVRFEGEMQYTRAFEQLQTALNDFRKEAASESQYYKTVVGSAIAVSTGLSVGYVVWLIRGGMLMSSVLFSMPAWQLADPLPLLNRADDDDDEKDDESLEKIIENGSPGKPNQMKETKKSKEAGTAL